MVYVFGKALLFSLPSQHVTKHVIAKLVEEHGPEQVRAIWRDEFIFDPSLVDPDFRELLTVAGGTSPTPPDHAVKCGTIEDIVEEGADLGAPTDAVLAELPEVLPSVTEFGLGTFDTVYVTVEADIERLKPFGIEAVLWEMPAFDPSALTVPELEEPDLSMLEPTRLERVAVRLPFGLGMHMLAAADEGARRVRSWRRRLGL